MVTAVRKGKSCCGRTKFYCDICGSAWDNVVLATKCEEECTLALKSSSN